MDILIVGENKINDYVIEYFAQKGMNTVNIADVYDLRSVSGEAGSFIAHTKDSDVKSGFVILTEQPSAEPAEIAGLTALTLQYAENVTIAQNAASLNPVVFLLDYISESPLAATISALKSAARFARSKRKVYYLAKFIRTAGRGIEELYREARETGVTFVKYEDLQISADLSEEEYTLLASDGAIEVEIITKTIFSDGGQDVGDRFAYAAKKLNLTKGKYGLLTEDMYYLTPALTSRRGVFHLTRDLVAERLDEGLHYICSLIQSGSCGTASYSSPPYSSASYGTAVIDSKKCVFCYNCYRACTHAALEPDPKVNQMQCLTAACEGCGVCTSICPANAITLEKDGANTGDESVVSKGNIAISTSYEGSEQDTGCGNDSAAEKAALVLCCENSVASIIDESIASLGCDFTGFDSLVVPCGGYIAMEQLSDNLAVYDKVMVVVCPDDACRHFDGNKRACAQIGRLHDMLTAAGLTPERVRYTQISHAMPGVLRDELSALIPNPEELS